MLYLRGLTGLHPGSGTALGAVDLPVQRERHTEWPVIPGTSLKGVLRDECQKHSPAAVQRLFGREGAADESNLFAGALSFTDARVLAFPVRSLKAVFAWVTCRQVLERWKRDAALIGAKLEPPMVEVKEGEAALVNGSPLSGGKVTLEEFEFTQKVLPGPVPAPVLDANEQKRVVVLDDTDFTHFVKYATEVTARIRLNSVTKTVDEHALFYQEFLPAETLFYSLVLAAPSRMKDDGADAAKNLADFQPPEYLQVGGDETTGKGLCAAKLARG